jgi:hypothetical protein
VIEYLKIFRVLQRMNTAWSIVEERLGPGHLSQYVHGERLSLVRYQSIVFSIVLWPTVALLSNLRWSTSPTYSNENLLKNTLRSSFLDSLSFSRTKAFETENIEK